MPVGTSVLVVAETASLGQAIADLLASVDVPNEVVHDVEGAGVPGSIGDRFPVIVVASRGYLCPTGRRWRRGDLPGTSLVVVGSRDPALEAEPDLRLIPLPLEPPQLLDTIQELISAAGSSPGSRPTATRSPTEPYAGRRGSSRDAAFRA